MLQQTQVSTVIPYYRRFLRAFPTVERLAKAPLERVLELWSGLGYYRRARLLHLAAQKILREFAGRFPTDYGQARALPGIGDYTARAILSIAYSRPCAVVDGNVARVVARLGAIKGNINQPKFRRAVERAVEGLLSRRSPGDFNQALMELGQTVCVPRAPRCVACPIRKWCQAYCQGKPESYPAPRPRRATELRYLATAVIRRGAVAAVCDRRPERSNIFGTHRAPLQRMEPNPPVHCTSPWEPRSRRAPSEQPVEVALVRGLDEGVLGDLWNFPAAFGATRAEAFDRLREKLGRIAPGVALWEQRDGLVARPAPLRQLRHGITHRSIRVDLYPAEVRGVPIGPLRWFSLASLNRVAVSQLARKIAAAAGEVDSPRN